MLAPLTEFREFKIQTSPLVILSAHYLRNQNEYRRITWNSRIGPRTMSSERIWDRVHYRLSSLVFTFSPISVSSPLFCRSFATAGADGIAGESERDAAAGGTRNGGCELFAV
jgi:hypothetical protein